MTADRDPMDALSALDNLSALDSLDSLDALDSLDSLDSLGELDAEEQQEPEGTPFDALEATGDLETDSRAEWDEIKQSFQQQDKNQRDQFRNLYDAGYYFTIVYKTADEADRGKALLLRILNVSAKRAGFGFWINGHHITRALEKIAKKLGVDTSDL